MIDTINGKVDAVTVPIEERLGVEALVEVIMNFASYGIEKYDEMVGALCGRVSYSYAPNNLDLYLKNRTTPPTCPSIEEPPTLELTALPPHFCYAFLEAKNILLVIISANLVKIEVDAWLLVLQIFKRAIGWTISDIVGIPSGICTHKIHLELDCIPSIKHQRRLNPLINVVVKKEIIKWMNVGVMYPIADSKLVSPIQCVPKKGGIIVKTNEKISSC